MLNGYVLGPSKLSREQFTDKYWMGGAEEYIYQFHTMDIEDGMDERQQLLINNDRALFNLIHAIARHGCIDKTGELSKLRERVLGTEKAARRLTILQLWGIVIVILRLLLLLSKKKQ